MTTKGGETIIITIMTGGGALTDVVVVEAGAVVVVRGVAIVVGVGLGLPAEAEAGAGMVSVRGRGMNTMTTAVEGKIMLHLTTMTKAMNKQKPTQKLRELDTVSLAPPYPTVRTTLKDARIKTI